MYAETEVIYADILFMLNFSLDYLCLFLTSRIINRASTPRRMVLGAVIGGFYAFLPYLQIANNAFASMLHIASAALICFAAFGKQDLKRFVLLTATFIVSSALFGGLITGIFNLSGNYSDGVYAEISAASFAVVCFVSTVIAFSYGLICRRKIHTRSSEIKIYINHEKIGARLLTDSGNLVTEPFSALPVIIISSSALPKPYDDPEGDFFPLPLRAIPFSTASGNSCFFGFRPDKIEIVALGKKPKRVDAYIAVDTSGNKYSGYDGILPASIL